MIWRTCSQLASAVARKQAKTSEKTVLPAATLFLDHALMASPVNPLNRSILMNHKTFVVQLYRRDKHNLVFRSVTSINATQLSTEVSYVNIDSSP